MTSDHSIRRAVQDGDPALGLALYQSLPNPTPEDDRWAGHGLVTLGRLLDAKDLLQRAHGRGHAPASIELARTLRLLGDDVPTRPSLLPDPQAWPDPADRVQAYLEDGERHLHAGQPRLALAATEDAWSAAQGDPHATSADRAVVATHLARAYATLGRTLHAEHYVALAAQHATGTHRVPALHVRAALAVASGRWTQAQQDLDEAAPLLVHAPLHAAQHHLHLADLRAALNDWPGAARAQDTAVTHAARTGQPHLQAQAELARAAVHTRHADPRARDALSRAAALSTSGAVQATLSLRRAAWQATQDDPHAETTLRDLHADLGARGLTRDAAACALHHANLLLPTRPEQALRGALDALHHAGTGAFTLCELRLLPALDAHLQAHATLPGVSSPADRRRPDPAPHAALHFRTLGTATLNLDGQDLRLRMKRTPELLAYLLHAGTATREQVLLALWPDDDPRRATNYFHQAKHELTRAAPSLHVQHDRRTGQYRVVSSGPALEWDVQAMLQGLHDAREDRVLRAIQTYGGPFLPDADTEWAREERDRIAWAVLTAGRALLTRWHARQEHHPCAALARQLLLISPHEEDIVEALTEATLHLEGPGSALNLIEEQQRHARRDLGRTPDWTTRLAGRVRATLGK